MALTSKMSEEVKEFAFSDIVDEDTEEAFENYLSDELCGNLLESWPWKAFSLTVIVLNAVVVGLGTSSAIVCDEKAAATVLSGADYVMLTIFVVEIVLKWYNGFWLFWQSGWNLFDFFIVAISILAKGLLTVVNRGVTFISSGRVLRILRVIRAFRALRSISALEGLQVIVSTVLRSMPDMINVMVLLVIFMFIYAVIGMSMFGAVLPEYFGQLDTAYYALFIYLTQDGWMDIFAALRDAGQFWPAAIYSMSFILLGSFVFVNVLVGVTVNYLQEAYKEIEIRKKAKSRKLHRHKQTDTNPYEDTMDIAHVPPTVWLHQKPDEVPDFSKISVAGLENYFMVLSAIEDNLVEFSKLKMTIEELYEEVAALNQREPDEEHEVDEEGGPAAPTTLHVDELPSAPGDVVSFKIRQANLERDARQKERQLQERQAATRRHVMTEGLQEQNQRQERALLWAQGKLARQRPQQQSTQPARGRGSIKTVLNKMDMGFAPGRD